MRARSTLDWSQSNNISCVLYQYYADNIILDAVASLFPCFIKIIVWSLIIIFGG